MILNKSRFVKYLGTFALLGSFSSTIPLFLSSCSTVYPTFTCTDAKKEWTKDTSVSIDAIWKGYYFGDVNAPWEVDNIEIPKEHEGDIQVNKSKSTKLKDDSNKTESCSVYFDIKSNWTRGAESFDVHVTWTIKHTNFKKVSTITIAKPVNGYINISQDFIYTSKPDTQFDINPADFKDNSIECVDGIYSSDDETDRSNIETHLTNDLIWYQYLVFKSLTYVYIDDSSNTYAELDDSTWKIHFDLKYDFTRKIFDYITLHAEAAGKVHTFLGMSFNANVAIDYSWGQLADSQKKTEAVPGPELMGAFTAVEADNRTHYSQGYIPKQEPNYQPYKQDFLALVPSNPDSYQTYSVDITPSVLPKMTSGQHVYFLSQPRFLGLEYATGQEHLLLRKQGSTDGKDSFRNWQLMLPSYSLSGMSYDFVNSKWINKCLQKPIQQCYVDISHDQQFSNYWSPGDKATWANSFMMGANYTDVNLDNDPGFIAMKKAEYAKNNKCLQGDDQVPWQNINIYDREGGTKLKGEIPYYKIIQQSSPNCSRSSSIDSGWNLATYYDSVNYHNMNIKFDADANKFIYFNMGLNYMFITDNMQTSGGDNVFYYDDEQLAKMNTDFINNPPS